ncbi:hypothetical protein BC829DRAFT_379529 [Chytridium lagenaria]|nr:hypothetical protein BC829DRAFT_379529 [Chytridium lagenaria]
MDAPARPLKCLVLFWPQLWLGYPKATKKGLVWFYICSIVWRIFPRNILRFYFRRSIMTIALSLQCERIRTPLSRSSHRLHIVFASLYVG